MSVLCRGLQSWTQDSRGVSPEWDRGAESPPSPCCPRCWGCSPGYGWPSGLRVHIGGSCPAFCPPVPPSPAWQGCSQSLHPPACINTGNSLTHVQDPALGRVEPHEGSRGPTSPACPGPSGWHPVLLVCQLHRSACVSCRLAESALDPSVSCMRMLNSTGPSTDP